MASNLDPSTAGWTTSNVLASSGENHTVAQQNAAMENGGWLFANKPIIISNPKSDSVSHLGTYCDICFWRPAGYNYLFLAVRMNPNAEAIQYVQVDLYDHRDGTTAWRKDFFSGTQAGPNSAWVYASSGDISGLFAEDDIIVGHLLAKSNDTSVCGYSGMIFACCGKDLAPSWSNLEI